MRAHMYNALTILVALTHALPIEDAEATWEIPYADTLDDTTHLLDKRALPFNRIVGFGDDLNDNSQGSYGHGITGDQNGGNKLLWGYGTWLDGPTAISWMAAALRVPIAYDYSFGSSGGGEKIGSVCNNALVPSNYADSYAHLNNGQLVPGAIQQIANYTGNAQMKANIGKTLHVLWTGNNDMTPYQRFFLCNDGSCAQGQTQFLQQLYQCQAQAMLSLVRAGAKYILVPDIYPKQLAPITHQYITQDATLIENYRQLIARANANLNSAINIINKQYGTQIKYFAANNLMTQGYRSPRSAGISAGVGGVGAPGYTSTCVDGCTAQAVSGQSNFQIWFDRTATKHMVDDFYWMTSVMPTTTVMRALAAWMVQMANSFK